MKIGDYVEKVQGYASESDDLPGKTGLVISLVRYTEEFKDLEPQLKINREPKVIVLTGDGNMEMWHQKFCEVICENR